MRHDEPNWGLAFACGSFLIVWALAAYSGVSYDVMLLRGGIAAILGGLLGVMVGYTLSGLGALYADLHEKGNSVDFTVSDDEPLLPMPTRANPHALDDEPAYREAVVPQATEPFQPIDLKSAAKHVQSLVQE